MGEGKQKTLGGSPKGWRSGWIEKGQFYKGRGLCEWKGACPFAEGGGEQNRGGKDLGPGVQERGGRPLSQDPSECQGEVFEEGGGTCRSMEGQKTINNGQAEKGEFKGV